MNDQEMLKLMAEVRSSRKAIGRDVSRLADELNFAKKTAEAVRQKPFAWLGSATFGGFLFSRLIFKGRGAKTNKRKMGNKKSETESQSKDVRSVTLWGFLLGMLRMIFPLFRPLLSAYATKQLSDMAASVMRDK